MEKEVNMHTVTVGERGQVVIPLDFRKEIGIEAHEKLVAMRIGTSVIYKRMDDFIKENWGEVLKKKMLKSI